jgi:hypothetical protein
VNPQLPRQIQSSPNPVLGIASLALGIGGMVMLFPMLLILLCGVIPFILGIAAIIVGLLGFSRVRKDPSRFSGKGLAIAGTILGLICVFAPMLWFAVTMGLYLYLGMNKPSGRFY